MPEPLNDPQVSTFVVEECNEQTWSYIWINKRGQDLTAHLKKKCRIPIKK